MNRPPPRVTLIACFVSAILAIHPSLSQAACPGPYASQACNGDSGADVCTFTSTTVTCNLAAGGGNQGTVGNFVNPSDTTFQGFGTDAEGELFCCEYSGLDGACDESDAPWISATFYGTDQVDTIKLQAGSYNLYCATPTVYGGSGDDDILGSRTLALNYLETLYGGTGADLIRGDTIYGDAGADLLFGGDDQDNIFGGAGNDKVKGEDGDDYIDGGGGADQACGGDGEDDIDGGSGDDALFDGVGTAGAQYLDGGAGTDTCGLSGYITDNDCTVSLTYCPW